MSRLIIGLTGKAGSGKSTAANIISRNFGFVQVSFAEPVKRAVKEIFGLSHWFDLNDPQVKDSLIPGTDVTYRHALQTLGTDWGRKMIAEDLWVDQVRRRLQYDYLNAVVTDVRFPDEAAMIRKMGGKIVHIERRNRSAAAGTDSHESEAGIEFRPRTDLKLDNNSNLQTFEAAVIRLVKDLYGGVYG
ncbi:hypothetical protein V9W64_10630 [Neisseria leonii]|uniref:Uncharacterized protein n=1 Tax=Neisseria leonii TaxID=2995413 RepID=A0A9X4EB89_9NEIS|nr:hypothetical protein [Neisseria sp. 51.81]MDD9328793.1 hypothetical protein [Neisseria sp. 51.81]